MARFRDQREEEPAPRPVGCPKCGSSALGAVREPVVARTPIFCGSCGTLMLADEIDGAAGVRLPTAFEAGILRDDPDVKRFTDAFIREQIDRAGNLKEKPRTDGAVLLDELERARRPD